MDNFGDNCTMHGLRQASSVQTAKPRRILWIMLLAGMLLCFAGLGIQTILHYTDYESYTTIQRVWNDTLQLPSVTMCNFNRLSRKKFNKMMQQLGFIYSFNNESKGIEELWKQAEGGTPLLFEPFMSVHNSAVQSIDDFVIWCMFLKKPFRCEDYITPVLTDGGVCASFNAKPHNGGGKTLTAKQLGSDFALHIVLDLHTEDHFRIPKSDRTLGTGLDVLVHHPKSFSYMSSGSVQLSPGWQHYLAVRLSYIQRLSKPYTTKACIEDNDYQFNECLFRCQVNLQYAGCDCKLENSDHPDACTFYNIMNCIDIDIEEYYEDACDCSPPCSAYEYSTRQSSISLPSGENLQHLINMTGTNRTEWKEIEQNIVYLQIYFDSMEYSIIKQTPAFVLYDLIANIGGLLGLFLGASIITVIELLEQGILVGYKVVSRRSASNRITDVSGEVNDGCDISENTKDVVSCISEKVKQKSTT